MFIVQSPSETPFNGDEVLGSSHILEASGVGLGPTSVRHRILRAPGRGQHHSHMIRAGQSGLETG